MTVKDINEVKYCDRNICLKNEYNNIGCEDCEVTKSQEPTTKNDLGVDCISRADVLNHLANIAKVKAKSDAQKSLMGRCLFMVEHLPSVTPQLSSGLAKNSKKIEKDSGELDCISRKAILDELEKWDWQELYLPIHFKQMLDELPSVTPQPRKGHWIDEGIYADGQSYHAFMCSACEWHFIENKSELEDYKYCPFCGADMREVKNDKRRDTNTDHSTT